VREEVVGRIDENDLGQSTRPEKDATVKFTHLPDEHSQNNEKKGIG
jgi:hypothetical protein